MQRRTFSKSLAAMLVVPLLKFQPKTIDRHELLNVFLGDDHFLGARYDLTRPYVVNQHAYASDGRIMARITTCEAEHDDEMIKVPPVELVWNAHFISTERKWETFKLADYNELVPPQSSWGATCPMCNDRRISFGDSYPTDQHTADQLPEYDPDDNTIRDASCEMCHGKSFFGGSYQKIGNQVIAYQYAKKLAEVPGCEVNIGAVMKHHRGSEFQAVLFRSEIGIAGVLYPVVL